MGKLSITNLYNKQIYTAHSQRGFVFTVLDRALLTLHMYCQVLSATNLDKALVLRQFRWLQGRHNKQQNSPMVSARCHRVYYIIVT